MLPNPGCGSSGIISLRSYQAEVLMLSSRARVGGPEEVQGWQLPPQQMTEVVQPMGCYRDLKTGLAHGDRE